jgi:hypothetical protein
MTRMTAAAAAAAAQLAGQTHAEVHSNVAGKTACQQLQIGQSICHAFRRFKRNWALHMVAAEYGITIDHMHG